MLPSSAKAHALMDSPVRHLEAQGVMLNVFNQLQGLDDLVVCASVSKTWNTLIREARPICLMIGSPAHFPSLDAAGAACALRWLQAKQRVGHLQNLREFWLFSEHLFRDEYEETRLQSAFFEAAIMCTGFWSLQRCTLEGPFCLEQAAALLPATLKQLELRPDMPPVHIDLSAFDRFSILQLLDLAGSLEDPSAASPPSRIYFNCSLPALRSLKTHAPFEVFTDPNDDVYDEIYSDDMHAALPCLVQLSVCVLADDDGRELASHFINLKGLKELELCLSGSLSRVILLKVLPSSSLSVLRLVGPPKNPEVSLEIYKKHLDYECFRVTNVFVKPSRYLSKLQIA